MEEAALAYDIATIQHRGAKAAYKLNRPDHPEVIAELAKAMQPGYQLIMPPPPPMGEDGMPVKKPRKLKPGEVEAHLAMADAGGAAGSGSMGEASGSVDGGVDGGMGVSIGLGGMPGAVSEGGEHAGYSVLGMGDGNDGSHSMVGMMTDPVSYAQYYQAMATALDGSTSLHSDELATYAPMHPAAAGTYADAVEAAAAAAAHMASGGMMGGDDIGIVGDGGEGAGAEYQ